MALTSPGVEVTITDQSQYLPAPIASVPLVVIATAQNKANASGTGVALGTTAANAGKLYQVTSQRDLVNLYGTPFFYTTTNGTPIQGYELNEYGLLAAYSVLGVSNRCYVLRANIDLASLVGQTSRPTGAPDNGTYWLDTTTSTWGIYEFNATTGQFTLQTPIVITDSALVSGGVPVQSLGNIGDYAVVAIANYDSPANAHEYFYKTYSTNEWVPLESNTWTSDWPTVQGSNSITPPTTLTAGSFNIFFSGSTATINIASGDSISDVVNTINGLGYAAISATNVSNKLNIFSKLPPGTGQSITISAGTGTVLTELGITAKTYYQPSVVYGTAAQMPLWTAGQTEPHPTGSVWIKVGSAGNGLNPVVSEYNAITATWTSKNVALGTSDWAVNASLDSSGGKAIPAGSVYAQYDYDTAYSYGEAPVYLWERIATGPTVVTGSNIVTTFSGIPGGSSTIQVLVSIPGSTALSSAYPVTISNGDTPTDFVTAWQGAGIPYTTASLTTTGAIQLTHTQGGAIDIVDYITSGSNQGKSSTIMSQAGFIIGTTTGVKYGTVQGMTYTKAFNSTNTASGTGTCSLVIAPKFNEYALAGPSNTGVSSSSNTTAGFLVGETVTVLGTQLGGLSTANDLTCKITAVDGGGKITAVTIASNPNPAVAVYATQLSNWVEFTYIANEGAPVVSPANNTNWFWSTVDQVDIMVNYDGQWNGYKSSSFGTFDSNGFPTPSGTNNTDPNGPIISATAPTTQSDGTDLVYGDLWIDTSDLENYPMINRWQAVGPSGNQIDQWVLLDNTDQTTSTGVVFADARWATNGDTNPANDPIPSISSLLASDYLDLDAPASSLYPNGMLLFNTRRSGYNVKQYRVNYFNSVNFPGEASYPTVTDAWVSVSGLQSNGAPNMGRNAQRSMIVQALRSVIDTNTDIRDEDNFFNLIATPQYPELQPNMVVLNADRGETGYIIGDTPLRLAANATDIQAWATNAAGATSTGEQGLVTRNTYLGIFYPSGITSDLSGNLVAVPASHMMLRTFIRNDTNAYPWLAAAGTRRGNIDNATNIGYVDATTGEFITTKTQLGLRDVLYTNFINPLVFFTGVGLLNYGNKTSYNSQSALDRTNVARLIAYIRRQLTIAARPFVFEPNDALTRNQIAGVIQSLMVDLVAKRGLYDYLVVCDESNNTPARIDRNELWVDVAVEPVKAAEFIYIPVRVLNTGEIAALG
jgi:Phage tail sheath C-terminal domain